MAQIVQIFSKKKKDENNDGFSKDFDELLRMAVLDLKKLKQEGISKVDIDPREYVRRRINAFLLEEKIMDPDLFRCALYVSVVLSKAFHESPESYYIIDYLIKGQEEENPAIIRDGADCCFLLCSFFPQRAERRSMTHSRDYFKWAPMPISRSI